MDKVESFFVVFASICYYGDVLDNDVLYVLSAMELLASRYTLVCNLGLIFN